MPMNYVEEEEFIEDKVIEKDEDDDDNKEEEEGEFITIITTFDHWSTFKNIMAQNMFNS